MQFATFPETVVPYCPYFSFVQAPLQNIAGPEQRKLQAQAVTVPSPATEAIGEAAMQARIVVSIGVNERDGGTLYNKSTSGSIRWSLRASSFARPPGWIQISRPRS